MENTKMGEMFGTLLFVCSEKDQESIDDIIKSDSGFLEDNTCDVEGPYRFHLDDPCSLYKVRFTDSQWIDIIDMGKTLEKSGIDTDVVHAVTDNNYIEIVSTSSYYDEFTDEAKLKGELFEKFGINISEDLVLDEEYED